MRYVEHELYINVDEAWMRALTRMRRQQSREGKLPSWVYNAIIRTEATSVEVVRDGTLRFSGPSEEYVVHVGTVALGKVRRRASYRSWRTFQWQKGVRTCYYCEVKMTLPPRKPKGNFVCTPITATVDHKTPLARGGEDTPRNWVMCCSACNNRKADMLEAEFRALMAKEASERVAQAA